MWAHKTIVVNDNVVQTARDMCEQLAGTGGAGMFATALSADGAEPASHWVSSGMILQDFAQMLENPAMVYAAAEQSGIELPAGSVEALLSQCDISDEQAETTLARMGLQYVAEDVANV